ncbi:protein FAR1-RELATED SEQUENCE 9-like [Cannabis sativa]|uniref:protein FAR1-RELATED SEQUENCE 9-like n=1 Tax=Cannabis sativa TaxID=3483 RepID=UPI0029CA04B4|nr:protein FAR1-RELATED SEQUENCE 9-like [Cannabis sativa]
MIEKYELKGNMWCEAQFLTRTMWADTFLRGHYFGDARATGRCESMNAFLKRDLVMDLPLWMFLRHCDISLAMLRYNEMREHYKTTMTDPVLNQTNMESVEDEKAWTRTNYTICSVAKYRHESRKRTVLYSDDGEDVRCDCYWFETNGIPCQHIFTCMKSLHKHSFQSCLINHRWLKDAKEILPANLGLERKCPHPQMIENSRYGGVTTQTSLVAFYATRSKASFELTMEVLSELLVKLEKIPRDEDYSQNNADDDEFGDKILDSRVLPTKGRPKLSRACKNSFGGSSRRAQSNSDVRAKKKKKLTSAPRYYKICRGTEHDSRNCPQKTD